MVWLWDCRLGSDAEFPVNVPCHVEGDEERRRKEEEGGKEGSVGFVR